MDAYKPTEVIIEDSFKEGNESALKFELGENIPLEDVTDISIEVRTVKGELVFSNSKNGGTIALEERILTIPIMPQDTIGKSGTHVFEVDFKNVRGNPFITLFGKLTINPQINKS